MIALLFYLATAQAHAAPTFQEVFDKVIDDKCTNCHGMYKQEKGVRLLKYTDVMRYVNLKEPEKSEILQITDNDTMPDDPVEPLSLSQKNLLRAWIMAGAPP